MGMVYALRFLRARWGFADENPRPVAVVGKLRKGDDEERKLGQHLEQYISLGYECCYNPPLGFEWV